MTLSVFYQDNEKCVIIDNEHFSFSVGVEKIIIRSKNVSKQLTIDEDSLEDLIKLLQDKQTTN